MSVAILKNEVKEMLSNMTEASEVQKDFVEISSKILIDLLNQNLTQQKELIDVKEQILKIRIEINSYHIRISQLEGKVR